MCLFKKTLTEPTITRVNSLLQLGTIGESFV
mgnify:CR=1 FL=1